MSKDGLMKRVVMAEQLRREDLHRVFNQFDADGSGEVSTSEMAAILQSLEVEKTDEEVRQLMRDCDPNGSGAIDFEEVSMCMWRTQYCSTVLFWSLKLCFPSLRERIICFWQSRCGNLAPHALLRSPLHHPRTRLAVSRSPRFTTAVCQGDDQRWRRWQPDATHRQGCRAAARAAAGHL